MKPTVKIASLLMAVLMVFSIFASGCTLSKEWSYKTDDEELAIGVYLTALYSAYKDAQNYASGLDGYDETSDKWLDMEITDDEGNTKVAREWIKDEAERRCLELLVLQDEIDKIGATKDEATASSDQANLKTLNENNEMQWYATDKDILYDEGVSFESYKYYMNNYSRLFDELFDLLFGKNGKQPVAKDELTKYVTDNYGRYSILQVPLYDSTTDETTSQTTKTAFTDDKIKEINTALDGIAKKVNAEKDAAKADETSSKQIKDYMTANKLEDTSLTTMPIKRTNSALTDKDLKKAVTELEPNKATIVKTGKDNDQNYYYIYRYDEASLKENYLNDTIPYQYNGQTINQPVLTEENLTKEYKSKDFKKYLKDAVDKKGYEKSDYVDKYDPDIFVKDAS